MSVLVGTAAIAGTHQNVSEENCIAKNELFGGLDHAGTLFPERSDDRLYQIGAEI